MISLMANRASLFFVGSFISAALGLYVSIFLSKYLSPDSYGIIGLFLLLCYVLEPLISLCAFPLYERKLSDSDDDQEDFKAKYLTSMLIVTFSLFCIFIVLDFYGVSFRYSLICLVYCFVKNINRVSEINANLKYRDFLVFSAPVVLSIVSAGVTIFLVEIHESHESRFVSLFVAEVVVCFLYVYNRIDLRFSTISFDFFCRVLSFGVPLIIGVGAAWVLHESDKIILLRYVSLPAVGIYTFCYAIGRNVDVFTVALSKAFRPILLNRLSAHQFGILFITKILLFLCLCYFFMVIFAYYFLYDVLSFLGVRREYLEYVDLALLVMISFSGFGLYRIAVVAMDYFKKNVAKTVILYFSAIINLIASLLLVSPFGIYGPAIGTVFGFWILFFITYVYTYRMSYRRAEYDR